MKEKLNDFFFARNEFALPVPDDTTSTYTFDITVSNGKYIINGNPSPTLTLLKGTTYSFVLTEVAYLMNPFLIGTSIGSPYSTVFVTKEYDNVKVNFPAPFNVPNTLVYYSSNSTVTGGTINFVEPTTYQVTPSGGIYLFNGYPQSNLQLTVGVSYSFVIRNTDQALFPLAFGTAINSPFLSNTAITVAVGSYATRFTLLFSDLSVPSLVYYNQNDALMSGTITITSSSSSAAKGSVGHHRQLGTILNTSPSSLPPCNGQYGNPRNNIRFSLYCTFANLATSIPPALTQTPYFISNTCDQIARSYLSTSIYYPTAWPPLQYCNQTPIANLDSCTVLANVLSWSNKWTCQDYCSTFPGKNCISVKNV